MSHETVTLRDFDIKNSDDQASRAGRVLANLTKRDGRKALSDHELALIDQSFAEGSGSDAF